MYDVLCDVNYQEHYNVAASSTVTDDVTYYFVHRLSDTNRVFRGFYLIFLFDEINEIFIGARFNTIYWRLQ